MLERVTFSTQRAAEFLEQRALQAQTGQPAARFGGVVVKELLDNALDACETAGVAPVVEVSVATGDAVQRITVCDNGTGMPVGVVERILDFNVLVSDKAAYRSVTRGQQGNAVKTLLGIPRALGVSEPVVIEAHQVRHEIALSLDPGGGVEPRHDKQASTRTVGTSVTVPLPASLTVDVAKWVKDFAVLNPHAAISHLANSADPENVVSYKPTAGDGWSKPLPTDPTSPHWYDNTALTRLVFAHIAAARNGGEDVPLGTFVRSFDGLKGTVKAKAVKAAVPGVERLSDFRDNPAAIGVLLAAMREHAKVPKPTVLGSVGEDHIRACLDAWYGVKRLWYKRKRLDHHGVPWVLEVAVATTHRPGRVVYGANYSSTFSDPLARTLLDAGEISTTGAESFLRHCDAFPVDDNGHLRAAVVHVICPAAEFLDKGKTALEVPRGR